jgi:predicted enzyme related to lactoylglutathione lyase
MNDDGLFMVSLMVSDMDIGIAHFTNDWGFALTNDTRHASGRRWVEIAPGCGARLRLIAAASDAERNVIGAQAGGRVAFFLRVTNLENRLAAWCANGIIVEEAARQESYGRIAVLRDRFGNRWDVSEAGELIGP